MIVGELLLASNVHAFLLLHVGKCCTKPSVSQQNIRQISCSVQQAFRSIHKIPFAALNNIEKQPFAKGVYGKYFCASMSVS